MNQKHLLSLLQTGFVTVGVEFAEDDGYIPSGLQAKGVKGKRTYTYKAPEADAVAVGDAVVVDTPSRGLVVAAVVRVDKTPQIDTDAPFEYKWIVQKVDRTRYDAQVAKEAEFLDQMREVERMHQRDQLMQKFTEHLPPDSPARKMFDAAVNSIKAIA